MKTHRFGIAFFAALGISASVWAQSQPSEVDNRLPGVVYDAVRPGPDGKPIPLTKAEIRRDIAFIAKFARAVKTINCLGQYREIPGECDRVGIDCYLTIPLGKPMTGDFAPTEGWDFRRGLDNIVALVKEGHPSLKGVTVGFLAVWTEKTNEELRQHIEEVRQKTKLPVGMMSDLRGWRTHREMIEAVDFVMLHCWPHSDGFAAQDAAAELAEDWQALVKIAGTKKVIVGDTGWSMAGGAKGQAELSPASAAQYLTDLTALAHKKNITYFWSQAFDRKPENMPSHWQTLGIFKADGKIKPAFLKLVTEAARAGVDRKPRSRQAPASEEQSQARIEWDEDTLTWRDDRAEGGPLHVVGGPSLLLRNKPDWPSDNGACFTGAIAIGPDS